MALDEDLEGIRIALLAKQDNTCILVIVIRCMAATTGSGISGNFVPRFPSQGSSCQEKSFHVLVQKLCLMQSLLASHIPRLRPGLSEGRNTLSPRGEPVERGRGEGV